jgi:hypothetical protein
MMAAYDKGFNEAVKDVLLTLEAEAVSSDKYIREYDDSKVQKAYNQALWKAYNIVKEMVCETNNPQPEHESHWIISSDGYYPYCSECGEEPQDGEMAEFCPNCLAKMSNPR